MKEMLAPGLLPPSASIQQTTRLFSLRQRTASTGIIPTASFSSFFDNIGAKIDPPIALVSDNANINGHIASTAHDINDHNNDALDPSPSPSAKEIARLRGELKLLREKHNSLVLALREANTQVRTKDILLEQLRERARTLAAEAADARRTADERRQELKSMERFLNKTDSWAGSDLVQALKDINNEILQFAAAASEAFPCPAPRPASAAATASTNTAHRPARSGTATPASGQQFGATSAHSTNNSSTATSLNITPGRRKALERVAARFGTKMRQCLERRDHAQDPTLLQYALQACTCQCISHAMASFCFGSTGKLEAHLSKIYQHMHASEPQPTSSRWRALTHQHIRALSPNIDALAISEVTDTCLRGVANVLAAAGSGEVDDLLTRAAAKYTPQLRRIAELANRFALIIREGTMSTDFQPVFIESVREFNPTTMENLYEGYGASKGRVLCTTEMGLQCLTNRGRDGKDYSAQTTERRVVLKPRVVLENIVQFLDR